MEILRSIPGYKAALKAVLKSQIQFLAEQLSKETDEETVILSASTVDGSLCPLGSQYGKLFLNDREYILSQFSNHCFLKTRRTFTEEEEITDTISPEKLPENNITEPVEPQNNAEPLLRVETIKEPGFMDEPETFSAVTIPKPGHEYMSSVTRFSNDHLKGYGRRKRKRKGHGKSAKQAKISLNLNDSSERDENNHIDTVEHQARRNVDVMAGDTNLDKTVDSKHVKMPFEVTLIETDDGIDVQNKAIVEPAFDDVGNKDETGVSSGENAKFIDDNAGHTLKQEVEEAARSKEIGGRMHKVAVEDGPTKEASSIVSSQPLPVVTYQSSHGETSYCADLTAEMKKFEEEILEIEQDKNVQQQATKLEQLKREVGVKKETVRQLRELKKVIIVSDGIAKDVTDIEGIALQVFHDDTISMITARLQSGEVSFENFNHVLFHVGTNDVSNKVPFDDIISDFGNLLGVCRKIKPSIKIAISAIVPRPVDHEESDEVVRMINSYLSKTMSKNMNFKFIRTYKPFMHSGTMRPELFDRSDGLHLSEEGTSRLRRYLLRTIASM